MPEWIITWLESAPWHQLLFVFLIENLVILMLVVLGGQILISWFSSRQVSLTPKPLTATEVIITFVNVLLNTDTTLAGLWLWRLGIVHFREDTGIFVLTDVLFLLLVMDLLMYLLHRMAHLPLLYSLLHQYHHQFDRMRPLTLFALNPLENLAFGGLWLAVIAIYLSTREIWFWLEFGATGSLSSKMDG